MQPGYLILQDFDGGAFYSTQKLITREHIIIRDLMNTHDGATYFAGRV
ncbi:hypothetical protein [Hymenobacter cavernae]|uniref:Uncharacterized protein n=1 Tax=Hymenobacter cavernae TaxID=2044852 RepID=A0ABQ1UR87_9BACT|nr:hypothetical protein [Hymenobacter cavernae]GGF23454.1 hypothetical protein GCM10011383_38850 [Hymenobacter cavernae]